MPRLGVSMHSEFAAKNTKMGANGRRVRDLSPLLEPEKPRASILADPTFLKWAGRLLFLAVGAVGFALWRLMDFAR